MKIIFVVALATVFATCAFATDSQDVCFKETLPYFQNFTKIKASITDKLIMLDRSCHELQNPEMTKRKSFVSGLSRKLMTFSVFGFLGHGASAFSQLNGSVKQKQFMEQLTKIKMIPDPMERIRQVYKLVVDTQGKYDYDTMGSKNMLSGKIFLTETPGNVIHNAEKRGTGGVCRDFASLLQWSLLQVARYQGSQQSAAGENDFSSDFIADDVPEGGHAWVRVHMPQIKDGKMAGFNTFDLDTTWYSDFSPLFPRNSSLSEANRIKAMRQCHQITSCLFKLDGYANEEFSNATTVPMNQRAMCGPGYAFASGSCIKSGAH